MREVEMQKLITDAVKERGGEGLKMSNRFLVGVADLLLKLPDLPALVMEVKQVLYSNPNTPRLFMLEVTTLQKKFLRDWDKAGMPACVGSFVQSPKGLKDLRFKVYDLPSLEARNWVANTQDHEALGGPDVRSNSITHHLHSFIWNWSNAKRL